MIRYPANLSASLLLGGLLIARPTQGTAVQVICDYAPFGSGSVIGCSQVLQEVRGKQADVVLAQRNDYSLAAHDSISIHQLLQTNPILKGRWKHVMEQAAVNTTTITEQSSKGGKSVLVAKQVPQLAQLIPSHDAYRHVLLEQRPDIRARESSYSEKQEMMQSNPVRFSLFVFADEYADKFHLLEFQQKLDLNLLKSEFTRVPVHTYAFEKWALSKADPISCEVGVTVLSQNVERDKNVQMRIDKMEECFGPVNTTLTFDFVPLLAQDQEMTMASVSYFSFLLVISQLSVFYFAFCSKYNQINKYGVSSYILDTERYKAVIRNFQRFQESSFGRFYQKDDEEEYIECHPANYVKHISLITLFMIAAAQAKLFFVLVKLENMLDNQILTLAFMLQLISTAVHFGFMISKMANSALMRMPSKDLQRQLFTSMNTILLFVLITAFCKTDYINILDQKVLLILYGGIWIPQILKDFTQSRQSCKDRMYCFCLTVQLNLLSLFAYGDESLLGLQPDPMFQLYLLILLLCQFLIESLLLRYKSRKFQDMMAEQDSQCTLTIWKALLFGPKQYTYEVSFKEVAQRIAKVRENRLDLEDSDGDDNYMAFNDNQVQEGDQEQYNGNNPLVDMQELSDQDEQNNSLIDIRMQQRQKRCRMGICCCSRKRRMAQAQIQELEQQLRRTDCSICLQKLVYDRTNEDTPLDTFYLTPCCHAFHAECLKTWLFSGRQICPICRQTLPKCIYQ